MVLTIKNILGSSQNSLSIIIPVYNRKALTLACLQNLRSHGDLFKYQVIVVDDNSSDGTSTAIQETYPEVIVLHGDGNLWWTGAIALGMKYAYDLGAEHLIWLNNDCEFSCNTISDLVGFVSEHEMAIAGCQGIERENPNKIVFGGKSKTWKGYRFMCPPSNTVTRCDLLSGNIVCLPRSVVNLIGYPDSKSTPHYGGDSLYLILATKAGFSIYIDSRNQVFSLHGESNLYPQKWLLGAGKPLDILKLVFVPQSGLSWRVWLKLNWEAYSVWGIVMFLKKYLSILIITGLRFLPLRLRQTLFANKYE
jgi:GT2 family glycosyltransferase